MKKLLVAAAAIVLAGAAQADSSVNLYGIVDAGVTYVDNADANGKSNVLVDTGVLNGNRWGLKGKESLGNGVTGVFQVESGFKLDDGTSGQGGRLFGRQAYAGVKLDGVGTATLGRQYDFMGDLYTYATMTNQFGGGYTENTFHNIDRVGGDRVDNSIKFQSADFAGAHFGVMAGLGERASNKKSGRALSAKIGYDGVPGLSVGAAYTRINGGIVAATSTDPQFDASAGKSESYGVGAAYKIGASTINGVVTFNKGQYASVTNGALHNSAQTALNSVKKFNVYELGYTHDITSQLSAGLGLQYLDNRTAGMKKADIYGGNVAVNYAFSKRTNAYGLVVYQQSKKIGGVVVNPIDITGAGASDTNKQVAVRVGLRHKF